MNCIDESGDREIQLSELLCFLYCVWRLELDRLRQDIRESQEGKQLVKSKKELDAIKERKKALKLVILKNFPRQFRETLRKSNRVRICGPFTGLLERMGYGGTSLDTDCVYDTDGMDSSPSPPRQRQKRYITLSFDIAYSIPCLGR